jgi:uncharacterized protein
MHVYHAPVKVRHHSDPADFLTAAGPLLLEDEARHNLILGLAGTLRDRPGYYSEFRLWVVERNGDLVAAALRTPPHNLVLARPAHPEALDALAEDLAAEGVDLPGVVAAVPEVDQFAAAWERRRGATRRQRRAQRIYRLDTLRPVENVPGRARVATGEDRQLLVDWLEAFTEEALGEDPGPAGDTERIVDGRLAGEGSGLLLWVDGEPVSMAGWGGPTPSGMRIGPVYTPPDRRGRGYGSAVTAALTAEQLAAGRRFCFLYTDLANPTSNKIYVDIGYEPVCDSVDYAFES